MIEDNKANGEKVRSENTHRWRKLHCTAGLQFNKTETDQ